ncbi:MAG: hypothetical protein U1F43_23920 [Myxococcota bacterium]
MPENRRPERAPLLAIAGSVLVLGAVLGLVYLQLWTRASEDLSRLLPATTRAWISSPPPWVGVTRALALDRWAGKDELQTALLTGGYLASGRTGEVAGLPVDLAREILRGMDAVEIAVVPTTEGPTAMIFVEIRDLALRKRVIARLQPITEAVGRHVGFRIDEIHQSPWQRFTGIDPEPPRVVIMDPWIVFSWGAEQGLEDLLDARVGGRRDAIRKRDGFVERGDRQEVRAVVDAASLWLLAHAAAEPDATPPPLPAEGLVQFLGLITFIGSVDATDDRAELLAEVDDRDLAAHLRAALAPGPHDLPPLLPADTLLSLSLATPDFKELSSVLDDLGQRLARDFLPALEPGPFADRLLAGLAALPRGGGEVTLGVLPLAGADLTRPDGPVDWVVLLRPRGNPAAVEAALAAALPAAFGDGYAHGEALVDDALVHAEVPHDPGDAPIVWRVRNGVVELAQTRAALDRLALAQASERTLGTADPSGRTGATAAGRLARARRGLPRASAIELLADASALSRIDAPILGLVERRLAGDFLLGATLTVDGDRLDATSNLGFWTLATAVAAASRDEIESFALPGLDPACRAAHFAMCRVYPDAVPCRPFSIGRRARILAACDALRRGGGIEPE